MKLSVYSLSLKDKKPEEVVGLALKHSCDGIEWWCKENGHVDADLLIPSAEKIAGLMQDSGIETAALSPYFKFDESKDKVSSIFSAAEMINAPNVRCHSYGFKDGDSAHGLMDKQRKWLEETVLPVLERHF